MRQSSILSMAMAVLLVVGFTVSGGAVAQERTVEGALRFLQQSNLEKAYAGNDDSQTKSNSYVRQRSYSTSDCTFSITTPTRTMNVDFKRISSSSLFAAWRSVQLAGHFRQTELVLIFDSSSSATRAQDAIQFLIEQCDINRDTGF